MTLDQAVAAAEDDLRAISLLGIKAAIAALIPSSVAFFLTLPGEFIWNLLTPLMTWIVNFPINAADNAGYYLYKAAQNNAAAGTYEDAQRATIAAAASGDTDALAKAKAAQRAAFIAFWNLNPK